ncbi:ankyrin repeat domain-containing protein [Candidatus Tisiphia endosymbiont of Hybos culiciformis]|uniref:ankyrin repeat domain-containing protein n=1 Tax=Candidatus Tisiphia endosymbiont of Hybos culiciformis TaxID=3139331 RepID=UPI003CCAC93F
MTKVEKLNPSELFLCFKSKMIQGTKMSKEEIIALVQQGFDLGEVDDHGYPALLWAAEYGHNEVVKFILEQKDNIFYNALTALVPLNAMAFHLACKNGHEDVKQSLQDSDPTLLSGDAANLDILAIMC